MTAGILQRVAQLLGFTPAIDWYSDRAKQGYRGIANHPLCVVAHGDGNAVTFTHAKIGLQARCQGIHLVKESAVGIASALVHHKLELTVCTSALQHLHQRFGCVFVGPVNMAVQSHILQFEDSARRGYFLFFTVYVSGCEAHESNPSVRNIQARYFNTIS